MPELPDENVISLARDLRKTRVNSNSVFVPEEELEQVTIENGLKYLDSGSECVVMASDSSRTDVVVAVNYAEIKNPTEAKLLYYRHRLLSTLFPHNFPKFYTSIGGSEAKGLPAITIRERVNIADSELSRDEIFNKGEQPFSEVILAIKNTGLPVHLDDSPFNFARDENGSVYYLDSVHTDSDHTSILQTQMTTAERWEKSRPLLEKWMAGKGYSEAGKRIVNMCLERTLVLEGEKVLV